MASVAPPQDLKEWHHPASRPSDIHELISGVDRYVPTNLQFMEEYLWTQVREGGSDLLANLAILKLYQFNPHLSNPEIIIHILLLALSSPSAGIGSPDFKLCLSLLREPAAILREAENEQGANDESLLVVMPWLEEVNQLIRTCKFTEFWKEWNSGSEGAKATQVFASQHPTLLASFRLLFASSVASTFSRVKLAQLSRWLDLSSADVKSWVSENGWSVEGESAVVPKNEDNSVKAGVVKENIELSQLTKLVAAAAY